MSEDGNDVLRNSGSDALRKVYDHGERVIPLQPRTMRSKKLQIGSDEELARIVIQDMQDELGNLIGNAGSLHAWNGNHWRLVPENETYAALQTYDGAAIAGSKHRIRLSEAKVRSILALIYRQTEQAKFFDEPAQGVAVENGFLTITRDGAQLVDHNPEHRNRHVLKARWNGEAGANSKPVLLDVLIDGCFSGDPECESKTKLLQEIAGALLIDPVRSLTSPKAIILFGEKACNGKSQMLQLLRGLVPETASACLSPAQMSDERHIIAIDGKLLNAVDEIGDRAIASEKFKAVVTGDRVTGRGLYKNGQDFRPQALHVFTANGFPEFKDGMDRGVVRRLLVLKFDRVIPADERVADIGRLIAEREADQLFAWAVVGAVRLLHEGHFTEPESSRIALQEWVQISDPVQAWLTDHDTVTITESPDDKVAIKQAYRSFQCWCKEMGIRDVAVPDQPRFTRRLKSSGVKGARVKRLSTGNHLYGVRLVGNQCRRGDA